MKSIGRDSCSMKSQRKARVPMSTNRERNWWSGKMKKNELEVIPTVVRRETDFLAMEDELVHCPSTALLCSEEVHPSISPRRRIQPMRSTCTLVRDSNAYSTLGSIDWQRPSSARIERVEHDYSYNPWRKDPDWSSRRFLKDHSACQQSIPDPPPLEAHHTRCNEKRASYHVMLSGLGTVEIVHHIDK